MELATERCLYQDAPREKNVLLFLRKQTGELFLIQ